MKITVLTDNYTYIDQYYLGEPALSLYIETEGRHFLLDTGYSDAFLKNAEKMGIDLSDLDLILLSHGHNDHTGGLKSLIEAFPNHRFSIMAHPDCFAPRQYENQEVGSPSSLAYLQQHCHIQFSAEPVRLTSQLTWLGQIPRKNSFESQEPIGYRQTDEGFVPDFLPDDTALAYQNKKGLFILTGCSHSGICNITEYAKEVCAESRVFGILGGLHLLKVNRQLAETIRYLKKENIRGLYPCHCVSFHCKVQLHREIPIHEVGTGMTLSLT